MHRRRWSKGVILNLIQIRNTSRTAAENLFNRFSKDEKRYKAFFFGLNSRRNVLLLVFSVWSTYLADLVVCGLDLLTGGE